jgi:predicted CoA-substrate-specific enzyme activase
MKALGICIGASTLTTAITDSAGSKFKLVSSTAIAHEGNPKKAITQYFSSHDISDIDSVLVTGRKFRSMMALSTIAEPEAVEAALGHMGAAGKFDTIVSAGGENFMVYSLDKEGRITKVMTGNKCASGTGEFFLQQIRRMGLSADQALKQGKAKEPYQISGRCSVFCKSDCTHALNRGTKKGEVISGLCRMMANKVTELLSKTEYRDVLVIGGCSRNTIMMDWLKKSLESITIPDEAMIFEALGASILAHSKKTKKIDRENLFSHKESRFSFHEPLSRYEDKVRFNRMERGTPKEGDECIIGLDCGSTTTKTVIIRTADNSILASDYLRTEGDPVRAAVNCYSSMKRQLAGVRLNITGLGVTGSGRQIAGLHALTKGIINEIIAHAKAAVFFDKDVDTIFEIGGQDAKYTYLTNGVASDYAMNEACSAGTGSFIEESAQETLNVHYTKIGDIALSAKSPPNFNDQCAAFISSDIKNASHEGISTEDIIAGLVYSICMNYANRVKGQRTVGKKVFMQGGVCYNRAIPIAMAALTGKEIIVPPEPGLMGAFGVALVVKEKISLGLMEKQKFELDTLIDRKVIYKKSFTCHGGEEGCDRKCSINMMEIEGRSYPFGGACNRYYNMRFKIASDPQSRDLVKLRQDLVFRKYLKAHNPDFGTTIGIPKSMNQNTLYPLYYNFFARLGFRVILADEPSPKGMEKIGAAFCYPMEIAHGMFKDLIDKNPDYIFMPHVQELHVKDDDYENKKKACVFAQAEPYIMRTTFKRESLPRFITPVLNFADGYASQEHVFLEIARKLGKDDKKAREAFRFAAGQLEEMQNEFKALGRKALAELEKDRERFAVVLFGRPYNAFAGEANLGIPHKFASRDIMVIPHDFLDSDDLPSYENMYWGHGQNILKSARFVEQHKQLFGVYITNFSCGPDSFIVQYFRNIMKVKPSLTLELDSHSADAGINTRIEAALDIMRSYVQLDRLGKIKHESDDFVPMKIIEKNNRYLVKDQEGNTYPLNDDRVEVILPSMGQLSTAMMESVLQGFGINAKALPIPTMETLKIGRANTSCKECLPYILTTGSMLEYIKNNATEGKKILFFMPKSRGPCRLGQYHVRINDLIMSKRLKNVAVWSLDDKNSYGGMGARFTYFGWIGIVMSDLAEDMRNAIYALAEDRQEGLKVFHQEYRKILDSFQTLRQKRIFDQMKSSAKVLSRIRLKRPITEAKFVSLIGEIFVRKEDFSRLDLLDRLAENGFVVRTAPVGEWLYYINYLNKNNVLEKRFNTMRYHISDFIQQKLERKIKEIFRESGLIHFEELIEVEKTIQHSRHLIPEDLTGEAILTVGIGLREIINDSHGVISIGPFACMPSRFAESILNSEMNIDGKSIGAKKDLKSEYNGISNLPFLAIETDGNLFPQIIQSKLEIFMLQANRLAKKVDSSA